jgi:hypothetical protein
VSLFFHAVSVKDPGGTQARGGMLTLPGCVPQSVAYSERWRSL